MSTHSDRNNFSAEILANLRREGLDAVADAIEARTPLDEWPDELRIELDKALYGTAFTLNGKRIDPTKVTVHRRLS